MPTKKKEQVENEVLKEELLYKMLNDTKLWIVSKRCGDFKTETLVSIMDRQDSCGELTEKQLSTLKNIYEKCDIANKVSRFCDYSVEHLANMEVVEPPICSITNTPISDWSVFKDGKYYSADAFSELVNKKYPRKVFVNKSK
jgi:hypothetical protein